MVKAKKISPYNVFVKNQDLKNNISVNTHFTYFKFVSTPYVEEKNFLIY